MMCKPSLIIRYMDGELNGAEHQAFITHLEGCPACQAKLENMKALQMGVKKDPVMNHALISAVMDRIDPNRYKKTNSPIKACVWRLVRACSPVLIPAFSLLLVMLLLLNPVSRNFIGRTAMTLLDKESRRYHYLADKIPFEPLSWTGAFIQTAGDALVSELNEKGMSVSTWEIIFASGDHLILRNYASLLMVKEGVMKKAADLIPLNLDHIQGSMITLFNASPDGRFVLAGNSIPSNEQIPEISAVYLIDTETGQYAKLFEGLMNDLVSSWSFNGQWLALTSRKDADMIRIFDLKSLKEARIRIPANDIEQIFISDSGVPAFYTGAQTALPSDYSLSRFDFEDQTGQLFYMDADKETLWFIQDGQIYSRRFGNTTAKSHHPKDMGTSPILDWKIEGKFLVSLRQDMKIHLFNLMDYTDKLFLSFDIAKHGTLPWCRVSPNGSYILFMSESGNPYLVHGSTTRQLKLTNRASLSLCWNQDRTLVYAELQSESAPKAGEFVIKQITVNDRISERFRSVPSQDQ